MKTTRKPKRTKSTWVTADGRSLHVREMEDSHLHNTIALIRRKAQTVRSSFNYFDSDNGGGEIAEQFLDSIPTYRALISEFNRRELGLPLAPATRTFDESRYEVLGLGRPTF